MVHNGTLRGTLVHMDRTKPTLGTKALLACGVIGCPLFVLVFLIEGATRVGYDPLRYPISSLSIGALGWMQAANFLMVGAAIFASALGMSRRGIRRPLCA